MTVAEVGDDEILEIQQFRREFREELAVGDERGAVATLAEVVVVAEQRDGCHGLGDGVVADGGVVFLVEIGVHAREGACLVLGRGVAASGEQSAVFEDAAEVREEGADGHRHGEFGAVAEVRGDLERLRGVLVGELLGELEDAELPGDTDIALNVGDAHARGRGQEPGEPLLSVFVEK